MKLRQNGGGALYVCTHTNGGGALHLCGPANFARPPHNKQAKNPKSCAHRDKLDQDLNTYTDFSLARQHSAASKRSKRPSSRTGVSSLSMNLGSWNRRSIPNCNSVLALSFKPSLSNFDRFIGKNTQHASDTSNYIHQILYAMKHILIVVY